ncbi:leucine-rich repeat serine/threonine-protein kinase 1 [Elysia marginata]|uniref:Leucine-rich repeat serine/threonine-protein kinase 1 n=1 Tax=Elysia marginata TaxID=1093978 RepID=A0AAV4EFG8_9GAST|nr:leucine-rich repeat serine/threonine-protein kinase 1 [Elysia marginata]
MLKGLPGVGSEVYGDGSKIIKKTLISSRLRRYSETRTLNASRGSINKKEKFPTFREVPGKKKMNKEEEVKIALKNADEKEFLRVLYSVTSQEQRAVFEANKWILCRICELGFTSALEHLLDLKVLDVNETYDNYACKAGHAEIVKHLLKWDAELNQDAWKKDSEFYLVSFYGHLDAAKTLYEKYKDFVEDSDICFSLLYTACLGGHVPLVHMWLKPGHDINQLVSFVPSLDSCEHYYPLFAACQGNHMDVALSLIRDCGAVLTQEICEQFTEFTTKLVKCLSLVESSKGELLFCLTKFNVEYPMPQWFHQSKDEYDKDADAYVNGIMIWSVGNSLRKLSGEILWHLPGLRQLDVSNNPSLIIEEPLRSSELMMNRKHESLPQVSFSGASMSATLTELFLGNNHLKSVPEGIADMTNLSLLDLKRNPSIVYLPPELGRLHKLLVLDLEGIIVPDKELQMLITGLSSKANTSRDVIMYLESKRRNCNPSDIFKLVVLGKEKKVYEKSLVQQLASRKKKLEAAPTHEHEACVLRPEILVLLVFPGGSSKTEIQSVENELLQNQRLPQFEFSGVKFFSICAGSRNFGDQLDKLWEEVENICIDMCDGRYEKKKLLAERKVPQFFLQVYQNIMQARETENLQVCPMEKFLEVAGCTCKDLKDFMEPDFTLEEFLLQSGAMLHYSNFNQDLTNCVFLDPAWLFKILTTFLKSLTSSMAKLSEAQVMERVEGLLPSGFDCFQAFLALLETFNIGFRIVDSSYEKILVIPSLLQEHPPLTQLPKYPNGLKAARLYRTPSLPLALWSHVISQLILAFNRFSYSHWKLGAGSRPGCGMQGLKVSDQNILFWRTGIFISHDQGYVVVEEIECRDKSGQKTPGILVTVQTNESSSMEENLHKLAVIGIVKDELEEVLEMFIPKFSDPLVAELKPFALCPHCHNTTPMLGFVKTDGLHFTSRDCAQAMLKKDIIVCQGGPTSLQQLVPELFFLELPEKMRLDYKDLKLNTDEQLGRGIAGEVLKGYFKDQEVAVKVFHQHQEMHKDTESLETLETSDQVQYTNCHPPNITDELKQRFEDKIESEQRKVNT